MFPFFSGLLIFSVFLERKRERGSTIPKIKRKFIVRHVRVGTKHVVRRVARPNGKFISQNLLAFDLSSLPLLILFLRGRWDRVHIYIARWYVLSRIEDNARLRPVEPALVTREKNLISFNIRLPLPIKDLFTAVY